MQSNYQAANIFIKALERPLFENYKQKNPDEKYLRL
jgi:hypothetical protein